MLRGDRRNERAHLQSADTASAHSPGAVFAWSGQSDAVRGMIPA
jgi:hypothetical protein